MVGLVVPCNLECWLRMLIAPCNFECWGRLRARCGGGSHESEHEGRLRRLTMGSSQSWASMSPDGFGGEAML